MKRAIYLEDRERDLARRVFSTVAGWLTEHIRSHGMFPIEKMAASWTRDEVEMLAAKFLDPTNDDEPDETDKN